MMKFANDLHRKGELHKIEQMEQLQKEHEQRTNGGLMGAFITEGHKGKYDMIGMMAQSPEFSEHEFNILYDEEEGKAVKINE